MHSKEVVLKKLFFVCQNAQKEHVEETDFKTFPGALILLEELHFTVREIVDGHFCDPG